MTYGIYTVLCIYVYVYIFRMLLFFRSDKDISTKGYEMNL